MSRSEDAVPDQLLEGQGAAAVLDGLPGGARAAVEAVLMVVDEPVTEEALADALELPSQQVHDVVQELQGDYERAHRGFVLRRFAGGWRIYTRSDCAAVVERFLLGGQQSRLTQASLETLAVIAYRQPVSRARISVVRGVNVDGVVRTLVARGLVQEVGQDREAGAVLYGTTDYFLQRMGMDSVEDLPALAPYLPSADLLDDLAAEGLG